MKYYHFTTSERFGLLAGGELRGRERGHVGDEHELGKGIGQALDAHSDREGEEVALAGAG